MAIDTRIDRRRLILDAALQIVVGHGAEAVRMADVAEAAGVSLGSIQHHFRNRDGLLAEVFRYESERISAAWRGVVVSDAAPLERLVEYVWLCTPPGSASAATSFDGWGFWLDFLGDRPPRTPDACRSGADLSELCAALSDRSRGWHLRRSNFGSAAPCGRSPIG